MILPLWHLIQKKHLKTLMKLCMDKQKLEVKEKIQWFVKNFEGTQKPFEK
jgi:hypothetical protein